MPDQLPDPQKLADEMDAIQTEDEEMVALRKLLFGLAGKGGATPVPDDYSELDAAEDAIARVETLMQVADNLDRIDDAADTAERALAVAERHAPTDDDRSKVDVARQTTRDCLIKQMALDTPGTAEQVPVAKIQERAEPAHDLAYQTVKDAWRDLTTEWACFHITTNEGGTRVCKVEPDDVELDLVRLVEHSLDRDDLAKRLITETSREGGR